MYAAHFAVSLGLKAAAPRVPIPALLMAGLAPDVAFALLMRTGVEHIDAPVGAPYADWRIVAPYSHGAVLAASGVLLFGVGLWLTSRKARVGGDERPLALAVLASARHAPGGLPGGIRCVAISALLTNHVVDAAARHGRATRLAHVAVDHWSTGGHADHALARSRRVLSLADPARSDSAERPRSPRYHRSAYRRCSPDAVA